MNVPKLRFKEFGDDWKDEKLEDVVDFLDDRRKPIKDSDRNNIKGIYPYYGASGIIDYINDYIFDEELLLLGEDGANILSRSTQLVFKATGKYWVNNHAHVLRPKENYNIDFLESYLENINYEPYNTGTAQPKLNQEVCRKINIKVPSLKEQVKIGKTLSLLDKKMELQTKKVEALKLFKKGLSPIIFNSINIISEKKLGNICSIKTGKLDANAMTTNGKYRFYTCAKNYYYTDNYAFDNEALLISGNGAYVGYIHYYKGKFNAYQRTYVLDSFLENIQYIKVYLEEFLPKRISLEKKEGNTPYIVLSTLYDMKIKLTDSKTEDKVINLFFYINRKIEQESQKFNKYNELKKGLIQSMFI